MSDYCSAIALASAIAFSFVGAKSIPFRFRVPRKLHAIPLPLLFPTKTAPLGLRGSLCGGHNLIAMRIARKKRPEKLSGRF